MAAPTEDSISKGGWIGIDLGTTNCTAAVWDVSRSRCKTLRLGYQNLARPNNGSSKGGKIVPSAVLFRNGGVDDRPLVGYAAMQANDNVSSSGDLVTSFKRIVGMTSRQAKEMQVSDPDFWNSLPFNTIFLDDDKNDIEINEEETIKQKGTQEALSDMLGSPTIDNGHTQSPKPQEIKEGVAICIHASNTSSSEEKQLASPLQVTTILLQSIRNAATEYLIKHNQSKIHTPGLSEEDTEDTQCINNCVIGVPAHYSHAQRNAIKNAAKKAGFIGTVSVMTESTAATMAYGLFVSPSVPRDSTDDTTVSSSGKNILVFDMGGGTTDCTIANIDFSKENGSVQFHVMATSGDRYLGGDDVDELLARYILRQYGSTTVESTTSNTATWRASDHQDLIRECRRAKEELCGNDNENNNAVVNEAQITLHRKTVTITRHEFETALQPLIDRAESVVDDALSVLLNHENTTMIHEVVLVGGSTHIPTIRSMLRRKFPPPIPPELCTSISAETAVAQGLAIQAALLSEAVPLYELRNAMMLDVLPHSIGVWVDVANVNKGSAPYTTGQIIQLNGMDKHHDGHFIEILHKDSPLPSMGNATFTLANDNQTGVSIIAVEHIGPGDIYQCMGVFDFLLYRLNGKEDTSSSRKAKRQVKIGMTLKSSGEFVVSIYDEYDPEHREKRRKYLQQRQDNDNEQTLNENMEACFYEDDEEKQPSCSGTEIALSLFCIIFFALYVAVRVAFSDVVDLASNEL